MVRRTAAMSRFSKSNRFTVPLGGLPTEGSAPNGSGKESPSDQKNGSKRQVDAKKCLTLSQEQEEKCNEVRFQGVSWMSRKGLKTRKGAVSNYGRLERECGGRRESRGPRGHLDAGSQEFGCGQAYDVGGGGGYGRATHARRAEQVGACAAATISLGSAFRAKRAAPGAEGSCKSRRHTGSRRFSGVRSENMSVQEAEREAEQKTGRDADAAECRNPMRGTLLQEKVKHTPIRFWERLPTLRIPIYSGTKTPKGPHCEEEVNYSIGGRHNSLPLDLSNTTPVTQTHHQHVTRSLDRNSLMYEKKFSLQTTGLATEKVSTPETRNNFLEFGICSPKAESHLVPVSNRTEFLGDANAPSVQIEPKQDHYCDVTFKYTSPGHGSTSTNNYLSGSSQIRNSDTITYDVERQEPSPKERYGTGKMNTSCYCSPKTTTNNNGLPNNLLHVPLNSKDLVTDMPTDEAHEYILTQNDEDLCDEQRNEDTLTNAKDKPLTQNSVCKCSQLEECSNGLIVETANLQFSIKANGASKEPHEVSKISQDIKLGLLVETKKEHRNMKGPSEGFSPGSNSNANITGKDFSNSSTAQIRNTPGDPCNFPSSIPGYHSKFPDIAATSTQDNIQEPKHSSWRRSDSNFDKDEDVLSSSSDYDFLLESHTTKQINDNSNTQDPLLPREELEITQVNIPRKEQHSNINDELANCNEKLLSSETLERNFETGSKGNALIKPFMVLPSSGKRFGALNNMAKCSSQKEAIKIRPADNVFNPPPVHLVNRSKSSRVEDLIRDNIKGHRKLCNSNVSDVNSAMNLLNKSVPVEPTVLHPGKENIEQRPEPNFNNLRNNVALKYDAKSLNGIQKSGSQSKPDRSEISEVNTLPSDNSINWIFGVVPKPIINGYSRFCQSMIIEKKFDAVKGALQRLLEIAETYSLQKKTDIKNSKWVTSRVHYTRDQLKLVEMLSDFIKAQQVVPTYESSPVKISNAEAPIELICSEGEIEYQTSETSSEEEEVHEFYNLIKNDGYDVDRWEGISNTAGSELKTVVVNSISDQVIIEPVDNVPVEEGPQSRARVLNVDYNSQSSSVEQDAANHALLTQKIHPRHIRRKTSGLTSKKLLEADPESQRLTKERELYRVLKKRVKELKGFNKDNLTSLVEAGVCRHNPQSRGPLISGSNDICGVDNYESSPIYHFQHPKLLYYYRSSELPEQLMTVPEPFIKRFDKERLMENGILADSVNNIEEIIPDFVDDSVGHDCAQDDVIQKSGGNLLSMSQFMLPELDDDAFSLEGFDLQSCEISLDTCKHTGFLSSLFSEGFQTLGAKIVTNASWRLITNEICIQIFDGQKAHKLSYLSAVDGIPELGCMRDIRNQLSSCQCRVEDPAIKNSSKGHNLSANSHKAMETPHVIQTDTFIAPLEVPPQSKIKYTSMSGFTLTPPNDKKELPAWRGSLRGAEVWIDPFHRDTHSSLILLCTDLFQRAGARIKTDFPFLDSTFVTDIHAVYVQKLDEREIWSFPETYNYFKKLGIDSRLLSRFQQQLDSSHTDSSPEIADAVSLPTTQQTDQRQHIAGNQHKKPTEDAQRIPVPRDSKQQSATPISHTNDLDSVHLSMHKIWKNYDIYEKPWFQNALKEQGDLISSIWRDRELKSERSVQDLKNIISELSSEVIRDQIQISTLQGQLAQHKNDLQLKDMEMQTLLKILESEVNSNSQKEDYIIKLLGRKE